MHYWNNPDGDGQSLSDCASDIFDDDMKETAAPDPTPEKKKRPPRKKKKKQTVPLETAKEEDEKGEVVVVEDGDKSESKEQAESEKAEINEHGESDTPADANTTTQITPKLPQASMITAAKLPSASASNIKAASRLNPNAAAWSTVGSKTSNTSKVPISAVNNNTAPLNRTPWATQPNAAKPQHTTKPAAAIRSDINVKTPVAVDNYKPKPGTWASMAVKKDTTSNHSAAAQSMPTPRQESRPQMKHSSGSPDWRNHVVSPHRSPYRKTSSQIVGVKNIDSIPAPPMSEPQQAWPTLNDFGPPLGGKKELPKVTKPIGAWGSKPL